MDGQSTARMAAAPTVGPQLGKIALDLLGRLPQITPRRIANLCGGHVSAEQLLKKRFPTAEVVSLQYVELAGGRAVKGSSGTRYRSIPMWHSSEPYDLVFCNGTLEIRPSLGQLVPELLSLTRPSSWLALQFPNNLNEPNRQIQRMLAVDGPWAKKLLPVAKTRPFNETIEGVNANLGSFCSFIDLWETTYVLRVDGVGAIIEAMKETSLPPFLAPLDDDMRQQFLRRFAAELAKAYPRQPDGKILWRFPRIFCLAQR